MAICNRRKNDTAVSFVIDTIIFWRHLVGVTNNLIVSKIRSMYQKRCNEIFPFNFSIGP